MAPTSTEPDPRRVDRTLPLTGDEFNALFDRFRYTVVRLEALPVYDVSEEHESIQAWRRGEPRPERSVRTSPWLARIAATTAVEHKRWQRVRVISEPPTEYERYELDAYVESQAAGEQILIAPRGAALDAVDGDLGQDVWLFDEGEPETSFAAVMLYGPTGQWIGVENVSDAAVLVAISERISAVREVAEPLNAYLAGSRAGA